MPVERRQILLSEAEVAQAVASYARTAPHFLPQGRVLGLRLEPQAEGGDAGAGLVVAVEAAYGATRAALEVRADPADLVALLVRFCLENNIPVPRRGTKAAALLDGRLALVIEYEHGAGDPAGV